MMHNLLDMLAIEQMQLDCTSCKTEEKAVARCSDCAEFLCPSCVTAHQHMRCFESHSVVKFDDIIRIYKRNMAKIASACHESENNDDDYEPDAQKHLNGKSPSSGSSSSSTNGCSTKLDEEIMNLNEKMKRKSSSSSSSASSTDYRCNFFKTNSRTSCASSSTTKLVIDCGVPIHKPLYCKDHVKENLKFFCTTCQVDISSACGCKKSNFL